ncbi:MAG: hypothetical protein E4H27_06550 [Anaerolineales bacterium]|nr:MAG: hypothetical protein E4H27_06550 [Anaerolineales bacterium]
MKRTNNDNVKRIALELSLKPFGRNDGKSPEVCARHVITAWRPLLEAAAEVSFMLWVADGSEILEWRGDLEQSLEWARYIGFCNAGRDVYDAHHHAPTRSAILYTEQPMGMCYAELKAIAGALREVGAELLDRPITIGATFDPGPEFAESPFKYNRHREIIVPKRVSGRPTFPMVDAAALLHADTQSYAAYPQGIPEGEPFALFLGKQIREYCRDIGFDYVWLSNGFGFSAVAWDYLGPGFDGEQFMPEERARYLERFKQAWNDLYRGNSEIPMEIRGSNFAAGMDIAKDGVDFAWLYDSGYVRLPPPNSPWGALNFDFGLEIAGFLSRAVKSPQGEYLFRYYPNDPWFWQNPWTDIFYGQAFDIYMPLATSVINSAGEITTPSTINFLTGDTEYGETDPLTGVQVAAHIRTALNDRPDDVGLITWIYPFEEYHRLASAGAAGQAEVFFGHWFVRSAINNGLPVASVGTPEAFDILLSNRRAAPQTIAFLPTAAVRREEDAQRLFAWLEKGVPVILYGPASSLHPSVLSYLGLELEHPLEGEFVLNTADGAIAGTLLHDPVGSAGGIAARFTANSGAELHYTAMSEAGERAYSVSASTTGGTQLTWIRGTNAFETRPDGTNLALKPKPQVVRYYDASKLGYEALGRLGYSIDVRCEASNAVAGQHPALMLFSRHDNAWYLSGYAAAPVGFVKLKFPDGAPVFHATFARLEGGAALYPLARTLHYECRVFVRQETGVIGCDPGARDEHHRELTLKITGLQDATVVFLPPEGAGVTFESAGKKSHYNAGETRVEQSGLSGKLLIHW